MVTDQGHVSDELLVRLLDDELSGAARERVERHVADCLDCAGRKRSLAATSGQVAEMLRMEADEPALHATGLRARVRVGMAGAERESLSALRWSLVGAVAGLPVVAILVGGLVLEHQASRARQSMVLAGLTEPDPRLTPGAIRQIGVTELCSEDGQDFDPQVPVSLREAVFQEYGMPGGRAGEYQVDYLVSPQLGGTDSLANLWPEPYGVPVWNARAKDALEQRLRQMVCKGEIDLPAAQEAIRADWIGAYRKYVSAEKPR